MSDLRERTLGFIAGICSGITKLIVGHPFGTFHGLNLDTIKIRIQTQDIGQFKGPLDCLKSTLKKVNNEFKSRKEQGHYIKVRLVMLN